MDKDRRDLINHLASELAGIMEDVSAESATLPRVPLAQLDRVIEALDREAAEAQSLTAAMLTLVRKPD